MVIIINANQGCSGGYPFEVSRFGYDYFFLEEKAMPFTVEIGSESKWHCLIRLNNQNVITLESKKLKNTLK